MANAYAGEVELTIGDETRVCKLTLGALAELEQKLEAQSLLSLIERFEAGQYSASDVLDIVVAGLRGGGWTGDRSDLLTLEIGGGIQEAARVAARLLVLAFAPFDT